MYLILGQNSLNSSAVRSRSGTVLHSEKPAVGAAMCQHACRFNFPVIPHEGIDLLFHWTVWHWSCTNTACAMIFSCVSSGNAAHCSTTAQPVAFAEHGSH